ncbi:MAG: flagellar motor switch protein FliN [Treponema sp.]|nr:flagellar motor switch protein FliN [Treponema sp.]
MSDGAISQDEIDALLSGVAVDGLNASGHVAGGPSVHIDTEALSKFAGNLKDPLVEKLNGMTGAEFSASDPQVEVVDRDGVLAKIPEVVVSVIHDYSAGMMGEHMYILAPEFAQKLVNLITKEENADFDDMALSCISDVVQNHSGSEIQELDKTGKFPGLACNVPEAASNPKAMLRLPQNQFAIVTYPLTLEGQTYNLWECIGGEPAEQISNAYGGGTAELESLGAADGSAGMDQMQQPMGGMPNMGMQQPMAGMNPMGGMPNMGMQQPMGAMNQMGYGMPNMGMQQPMGAMMGFGMGQNMGMNVPNVQSLQYPSLQGANASGEQGNISLIMDVQMEMTVELGRTKKQIKDILGMGEGTIIELDKLAGEPVDILVNHKPIAKGEVVVIDENFGVRVTEILSPLERVSDLH